MINKISKHCDSKILIVSDDTDKYVAIERILLGISKTAISRAKHCDAFNSISRIAFDLVIVYGNAESILDKDSFIYKTKEKLRYTPTIIVIVDEKDIKHIRAISNIKEVDFCITLDTTSIISTELFQDTVLTAIELKRINKIDFSYKKNNIILNIPKFVGIGLAISTGGPKTIYDVFEKIPKNFVPPIFIVQHGPDYVMEAYVANFKGRFGLNAVIAKNDEPIKANMIYIAPDKLNMEIDKRSFSIKLLDSEKECFVKPSANPLFRSIARTFGEFSIGVVMTGMGSDGSKGCLHIEAMGGTIFVENPKTAMAPSMPRETFAIVQNCKVHSSKLLGQAIVTEANRISESLQNIRRALI